MTALTLTAFRACSMSQIRLRFLLCSAAALGLAGCAATHKAPASPAATAKVGIGIATAQRALPTITSNVSQPAHYQHVFIDTADVNAGSLQTVTLPDAVNSNVLASSEIQVKPLGKIEPGSLRWVVLEKGFPRPKELEGVGGADLKASTFTEVNFDLNQAQILDRSKLDEVVKLASRVSGQFYVVGYADETGVEAQNVSLSQDRAKAVSEVLVSAGVNRSRVKEFGAGVSRTYRGLDANRRASVTFRVVE